MNQSNEKIPQTVSGWTLYERQSESKYPLTPPIINDFFRRSVPTGTESKKMIRSIPSATISILDADISDVVRKAVNGLSSSYIFPEPDRVRQLLCSNNTLRGMLVKIYSNIRKEFPLEKIKLDVFSDSPYSSEKDIVVSVVTSLPVDEAIDRMDRVEDVRWNRDSKDPYINICVSLEYL